jgi:hypothetical protein
MPPLVLGIELVPQLTFNPLLEHVEDACQRIARRFGDDADLALGIATIQFLIRGFGPLVVILELNMFIWEESRGRVSLFCIDSLPRLP